MDVTNLVLNLKSIMTDDPASQQMISKAIMLLELGAVEQVESISLLPSPSENAGKLYYANFDGLYWSTGLEWLAITLTNQNANFIFAWGSNSSGRLGDGTSTRRSSPVSVIGGFTDWCQVSGGGGHSLGLRSNGTAWAWGSNTCGRLGDGTTTDRSFPVLVAGGFTDWCQVAAAFCHNLGVRTNGTAWAWGFNNSGRLGDGTTTDRSSPVLVAGGFTDWCQVATGLFHGLGVRTNGTMWAWGANGFGELGTGTTIISSSPVSVIGGFTDWCQASGGRQHSLGLRINGTLWSWGCNVNGQLGDGTVTPRSSPVSVIGGFTDWCQVSTRGRHSLGVRSNGTAWVWGLNNNGYLGDGTTTDRSSPVLVAGGFTDWCQMAGEYRHSLGLRSNGTAWAWGCNCTGQLGDGTEIDRSSPVSVIGGFTDWCQVSAGRFHSLAIRSRST